MAIGSAIERGSLIQVFDTDARCSRRPGGNGTNDGLIGFTGSTVTVRFGSVMTTFDEHGMTIYSKAA